MAHDPRCNNVQRDINSLARNVIRLTLALEVLAQNVKIDDRAGERVDDLIHMIRYED